MHIVSWNYAAWSGTCLPRTKHTTHGKDMCVTLRSSMYCFADCLGAWKHFVIDCLLLLCLVVVCYRLAVPVPVLLQMSPMATSPKDFLRIGHSEGSKIAKFPRRLRRRDIGFPSRHVGPGLNVILLPKMINWFSWPPAGWNDMGILIRKCYFYFRLMNYCRARRGEIEMTFYSFLIYYVFTTF